MREVRWREEKMGDYHCVEIEDGGRVVLRVGFSHKPSKGDLDEIVQQVRQMRQEPSIEREGMLERMRRERLEAILRELEFLIPPQKVAQIRQILQTELTPTKEVKVERWQP